MKKVYKLIIISIVLFTIGSCEHEILRSDSDNLNDISITIQGKYSMDCEPNVFLDAEGANYKLFLPDTILSGSLNADGFGYENDIPDSKNGLVDVTLILFYQGKQSSPQYIDIMCCDSELHDSIVDVSCDPPDTLFCEALNKDEVLNITSEYIKCVKVHEDELVGNWFSFVCPSDLKIVTDESVFTNNGENIWVDGGISTLRTGESTIALNEGELFVVYFDLLNDEYTETNVYQRVFNFEVTCIKTDGTEGESGMIQYTVNSELCDPDVCECPVSDGYTIEEGLGIYDPVLIGTAENISISLSDVLQNLGENCLYQIDSIVKLTTDGVWTIDTINISSLIENGNNKLTATFAPVETVIYDESFIVYTTITPLNYPEGAAQCSFNINLTGKGCEAVCPEIQLLSGGEAFLSIEGDDDKTIQQLYKQLFSTDSVINQSIDVVKKLECNEIDQILQDGYVSYLLIEPNGEYVCNDPDWEFDVVKTNDPNGIFNVQLLGSILNVTVDRSNDEGIYNCTLTVSYGNNCVQTIILKTEIKNTPSFNNNEWTMQMFAQEPDEGYFPRSLKVYDITEWDQTNTRFGTMKTLADNGVYGYDGDDYFAPTKYSFYFEVDDVNAYEPQDPKLYLVSTASNSFDHIAKINTQVSITTINDFKDACKDDDFINDVISQGRSNGLSWMWDDPISANSMQWEDQSGIQINEFDVYVLWNPNSNINESDELFCEVALLYVYKINRGADPSRINGNDRAEVTFFVQYPLVNP